MTEIAQPILPSQREPDALFALQSENARLQLQVASLQQDLADAEVHRELLQREIALVQELGDVIVSDLDLERVLGLVATKGRELIQAETFLVPIINKTRTSYTYAAACGKDAKDILGVSFPVRIGMCGWVITHERPLLFGESREWLMDEKTAWEEGQPSALLVPLMVKHRIIGGLSGMGKAGGGSFVRRDLELLTLFANQVSIAIENASLYKEIGELVDSLELRVEQRTRELAAINQELEAFSYSVSHDLRAPLRSIDGFSQALVEDYASTLDDTAIGYLHRIRSNAQHMGKLIEALLKLSRLTRDEMAIEAVDLSAIAAEIVTRLQESAPDRHVTFSVQNGLAITADERMMRVVMENLLNNAWKYTGKRVDASIEFGLADVPGRGASFYVRDNGAGFDMNQADKLFRPFKRLHAEREFSGDGIGLASVQRVIQRHGGQLWAEAAVDQGAAFFFTLPQQ